MQIKVHVDISLYFNKMPFAFGFNDSFVWGKKKTLNQAKMLSWP